MASAILAHPELNIIEERADGFAARWRHLLVIVSERRELDGKRWRHASVSRKDSQLPTYADLRELKRLCIGDDRTALQVFPPAAKHIDWAGPRGREVLHLWCCLDGDVTPDFAPEG